MLKRIAACFLCILPGAGAAADSSWRDARQIVVVVTPDWDSPQGMMRVFERDGPQWQARFPEQPVTVGRSGSAWGDGVHPAMPGPQKREGDGRSPAGVFRIGIAFGYAPSEPTALRYKGMTASDHCIDVSRSPSYNSIIDADVAGQSAVEGSTEPMRRDLHANGDQRYKLGFVIEHNPRGQPDAGSCIFAHLWRQPGEPTAGCTAMAEPFMRDLLGWLDADKKPVFVLLPQQQYAQVRQAWGLP